MQLTLAQKILVLQIIIYEIITVLNYKNSVNSLFRWSLIFSQYSVENKHYCQAI